MEQIVKKIGANYIAWFKQSNSWIQFEEPAWFVNKHYQKGFDKETIASKVSKKYLISNVESLRFVDEICTGIRVFEKPVYNPLENIRAKKNKEVLTFKPYSIRYYLVYGKSIVVEYNTRLAEYYIHPPLAHLETSSSIGISDLHYKIMSKEDNTALLNCGNTEYSYVFKDFNRLNKRLYIDLANNIYNKTNSDWLALVHASAISDGNQTVLLSSSCGSGKSTMAALLQTKGLKIVSDDFVPIDVKTKKAFPFPAALSVKHGAFSVLSPIYGDFHDKNFNSYEYSHSSIKYLAPNISEGQKLKPKPVKSIIFIQYNAQADCNFQALTFMEAFKLFHDQSWVSNETKHAKSFINWFVKIPCYKLEYGNSEKGVNKILDIFNSKTRN